MDLYDQTTSEMSRHMTERYSTSFSTASKMFGKSIRPHIYNIYGLVRLADEIVDTYSGDDRSELLSELEKETIAALKRGYSANPVVHAFQLSATPYGINPELIEPFFASMRMDTVKNTYDTKAYKRYIYGSAEVIGLMCLAVFCGGRNTSYAKLKDGAIHLGAAYQKINFLRDMADDYVTLGRVYFPGIKYDHMSDVDKDSIVADIREDLELALPAVRKLPNNAKRAVSISYRYYSAVLDKLDRAPLAEIRRKRIRLSKPEKMLIFASTTLRGGI